MPHITYLAESLFRYSKRRSPKMAYLITVSCWQPHFLADTAFIPIPYELIVQVDAQYMV